MRMLLITLSAALILLSIVPQAGTAKSHPKCGGDNSRCGNLAKVCNPKNGRCRCASYGVERYHAAERVSADAGKRALNELLRLVPEKNG